MANPPVNKTFNETHQELTPPTTAIKPPLPVFNTSNPCSRSLDVHPSHEIWLNRVIRPVIAHAQLRQA